MRSDTAAPPVKPVSADCVASRRGTFICVIPCEGPTAFTHLIGEFDQAIAEAAAHGVFVAPEQRQEDFHCEKDMWFHA